MSHQKKKNSVKGKVIVVNLEEMYNESSMLKFHWRQNEGCSLGYKTSDSSEKLRQRGSWGRSIYVILVKEELMQTTTYLTKMFSARS